MMATRRATEADLDRILELGHLFYQERRAMLAPAYRHTEAPNPLDTMRTRISGDGFRTYVADHEGWIIAYLVARITTVPLPHDRFEREGRICDAFVLPEHRGQGVASALYAAASSWFDEEGCECEGLTVYANNPALTLYERWGFAPFSLNMRKRRIGGPGGEGHRADAGGRSPVGR